MYFYKGVNTEEKRVLEKVFNDEDEAIEFARDNAYQYQKYTVKDSDNEIIESNEVAEEEEDAINDNMFPEEDSMEGFDVDDFFDND